MKPWKIRNSLTRRWNGNIQKKSKHMKVTRRRRRYRCSRLDSTLKQHHITERKLRNEKKINLKFSTRHIHSFSMSIYSRQWFKGCFFGVFVKYVMLFSGLGSLTISSFCTLSYGFFFEQDFRFSKQHSRPPIYLRLHFSSRQWQT